MDQTGHGLCQVFCSYYIRLTPTQMMVLFGTVNSPIKAPFVIVGLTALQLTAEWAFQLVKPLKVMTLQGLSLTH